MSIHDFDNAMARAAGRPRFLAGPESALETDTVRLSANFAAIEAEIDAPAPGFLARVLVRLGVGEGTVPLVTATPALRRSFVVSVLIAVLFALPALSLAGLPPFSGFVAKLALVDAGVASGAWVIVTVSLVGSILTLLSMTKIWLGAFWGETTAPAVPASSTRSVTIMQSAAGIAVAGTIAVAVVAGPLWNVSERIAADLLDRAPYITAVLG